MNKKAALVLVILIIVLLSQFKIGGYFVKNTEIQDPIIVEFPLRGEWQSPNTPGTKIPSHGTDRLGTRYAYDFIQVDWNRSGWPAYRSSLPKYLVSGLPISDYYCWGQEIYAPFDGEVVLAEDHYPERERTNLRTDLVNAYKNANHFDPVIDDARTVAGNYVIIKQVEKVYAALCHLQAGSVQVAAGQRVKKGQLIGRVGHSGNSFGPHLHFQLMDSSNIVKAQGLPCAFERYELYQEGQWKKVDKGIPTNKDRIRFLY
nr:M23 family metallopeptidase [Enterococcus sp. 665A]